MLSLIRSWGMLASTETVPLEHILRLLLLLILTPIAFQLAVTPLPRAQGGGLRAGDSSSDTARGEVQRDIPNMHKAPFFWTVMFASVVGWILGMVKGFDGSRDWLARYWPTAPKPILFGLDFFIFVIVGAYVGTGLYQPAAFPAAIAAGVSWPVGLGALVSKTGAAPSSPSPAPVAPIATEQPSGAHTHSNSTPALGEPNDHRK
jgi:hypothetical protein